MTDKSFRLVAAVAFAAFASITPRASAQDPLAYIDAANADAGKYDPKDAGNSSASALPKPIIGGSGLPVHAVMKAMNGLSADKGLSRDLRDTQIFKTASPAVVLIVTESGLGSGSLLTKEGLVLTNHHVIAGARDVAVLFKPQQKGATPKEAEAIAAKIIRINADKDLALLQIARVPEGIAPIPMGTMDEVDIGGDVHAIGHPRGEAWTYTKGVVSQIRDGYTWEGGDRIQRKATVIQTQTPINPGNSGGPLLNDQGKLVGVNSFGATDAQGLNYAVSVADVDAFLKQKADVAPTRTALSLPFKETPTCSDPQVLYEGPNYDRTADLQILDTTCKKTANAQYVLPRDPERPLSLALFENGNYAHSTVMYFDNKRKAEWEFSVWRENPQGSWELACYHDDGSLKPTTCEKYEKALARRNANPQR